MGDSDQANHYRVPFDGSFRIADARTRAPRGSGNKAARQQQLAAEVARLDEWQRCLQADGRYAVLLVFQAMDAAGKDSTIRAVLTGVNPAGCSVRSFKRPSSEELAHDFLWRCARELPARGSIGVFNRSYYEEVLTVRVHPDLLDAQHLPPRKDKLDQLWAERYESINAFEQHLARNGTVILKFWLNVSPEEQRKRLLARLEQPEKNWKFESGDLSDRARWADYMQAYEDLLRATSKPWAPWYAIPADSKSYMRAQVARIVTQRLAELDLQYPQPDAALRQQFGEMEKRLKSQAR